ncbi:MAG: nucleotide exchange factor GrpE [Oscillospiraceae bacterium]|nr:nucleotide exchange factor GrpE [Oscillospiraceae bacterium]
MPKKKETVDAVNAGIEKETLDGVDTEETKEEEKSAEEILQDEIDSLNDRLLRVMAEYDNYRKRTAKEMEQKYGDSKADVIIKLLPVMDNFDRAEISGNSKKSFEEYKKGVEMIYAQLAETLKSMDAEAYGEAGEAFDPMLHNAVMHIEDESLPENVIASVFAKGYKMGERVLREASVQVAN